MSVKREVDQRRVEIPQANRKGRYSSLGLLLIGFLGGIFTHSYFSSQVTVEPRTVAAPGEALVKSDQQRPMSVDRSAMKAPARTIAEVTKPQDQNPGSPEHLSAPAKSESISGFTPEGQEYACLPKVGEIVGNRCIYANACASCKNARVVINAGGDGFACSEGQTVPDVVTASCCALRDAQNHLSCPPIDVCSHEEGTRVCE